MKTPIAYITEYVPEVICKMFGHNESERLEVHSTIDGKTSKETNRFGYLTKRCKRCGKQLSKKKLKGDKLEKEIQSRWVKPIMFNCPSGGN